jgi:hypothetical protein
MKLIAEIWRENMEVTKQFNERDLLVQVLSDFPEILTNQHIQQFTAWSVNTINKYASDGKLPAPLPKLGRIKRYSKSSFIDFWLTKNQDQPEIIKPSKVGRPTIAEKLNKIRG